MGSLFSFLKKRKRNKELAILKSKALSNVDGIIKQPIELEHLLRYLIKAEALPDFKLKVSATFPLKECEKIIDVLSGSADNLLEGKVKWRGIALETRAHPYVTDRTTVKVWADIWYDNHNVKERLEKLFNSVVVLNQTLSKHGLEPDKIYHAIFSKPVSKEVDSFINGYIKISSEIYACFKEIYHESLK